MRSLQKRLRRAEVYPPVRTIDRNLCVNCGKCVKLCPTTALENSVSDATCEEIISVVRKDAAFYGDDGGITLSGGEPTFQSEAAVELLRLAKTAKLNTAIETCGSYSPSINSTLAENLDCVLFDLKDTNGARLKENTGGNLDLILTNLRALDAAGVKITLRCIILAGINDNEEHIRNIKKISGTVNNLEGIELIPYHAYGTGKYENFGYENDFNRKSKVPQNETMEKLNLLLHI